MTELRITRSSDIELYINDEKLFGVTDFSAKAKYESHPIRECLSGEPFAIVNGKITYELRMTVLSLFRFAVTEELGFDLKVVDDEVVYIYEDCAVDCRDREIKAGKAVVDTFVITAKSMRKQVREDAG